MKKNHLILPFICCAAILAGCGNGSANETTAAPVTEAAQTTTAQAETSVAETTETAAEEVAVSYPLELVVYDGQGNEYAQTFEQAPEHIVTTSTSAAEILIALGLEDKIVGITKPDNQVPEELQPIFESFNSVGDRKTLSKEVIVAAEPDIVIGRVTSFTEEMSIDSYAELGILSYTQLAGNATVTSKPEALFDDIKNLGKIFDIEETAEEYASQLEDRLNEVKEAAASRSADENLRSLIMVNFNEGVFGVMNGELQDEIMAIVGCEDIADKGQSGLSYENLIEYNPDVIVYIMADRNATTDATAIETMLNEDLLKTVPAVANQKIIPIAYDSIMDVGPRMIDAIEELNAALSE